jgi:hypothetical protein
MLKVSEPEGKNYIKRLTTDSSLKVTVARSSITAHYLNKKSRSAKNAISREVFMTIPIVIYSRQDFYLLNSINEEIEKLKSSGLIDFWTYASIKRDQSPTISSLPQALQVKHFKGIFYIVALGWTVSFVAAVCECFIKKLPRKPISLCRKQNS